MITRVRPSWRPINCSDRTAAPADISVVSRFAFAILFMLCSQCWIGMWPPPEPVGRALCEARSRPAAVSADPGNDRLSNGSFAPGIEARSGPRLSLRPMTSPAARIKGQARPSRLSRRQKNGFPPAAEPSVFSPSRPLDPNDRRRGAGCALPPLSGGMSEAIPPERPRRLRPKGAPLRETGNQGDRQ